VGIDLFILHMYGIEELEAVEYAGIVSAGFPLAVRTDMPNNSSDKLRCSPVVNTAAAIFFGGGTRLPSS
jgi:hypothetical protein